MRLARQTVAWPPVPRRSRSSQGSRAPATMPRRSSAARRSSAEAGTLLPASRRAGARGVEHWRSQGSNCGSFESAIAPGRAKPALRRRQPRGLRQTMREIRPTAGLKRAAPTEGSVGQNGQTSAAFMHRGPKTGLVYAPHQALNSVRRKPAPCPSRQWRRCAHSRLSARRCRFR